MAGSEAAATAALRMQLVELKERGNKAFALGKFSAAISVYTEALTIAEPPMPALRGDVSVLRSNRALCHKNVGDWDACEADARRAIELDNGNSKAHYLLGLVGLNAGRYSVAVPALEEALKRAERAKKPESLLREFRGAIASGRHRWREDEIAKERLKDSLLRSLVDASLSSAAKEVEASGAGSAGSDGGSEELDMTPAAAWAHFESIMAGREAARETSDIPDWVACEITFEPMLDPVTTPSGHSFERAAIEEYIRKSPRPEDPHSKVPLSFGDLRPNVSLKKAISEWLAANPWAHPLRAAAPASASGGSAAGGQ